LLAVTDPAVENGGVQIGEAGKIIKGGFHLRGQLPRRLQHQTAALGLMAVEQRQNGRANAAVLPVPVCALPITSRPCMMSGMVRT